MRALVFSLLGLAACQGPQGPAGVPGPPGRIWDQDPPPDARVVDAAPDALPDAQPADAAPDTALDATADGGLDAAVDASVDAGLPDCPPWTGPAGMGGPVDAILSLEEVQRWRDFRAAREQERLLEAWRPDVVHARFRPADARCLSFGQQVDLGRALFMRVFTPAEGFGDGTPGLRRFQRDHAGGPDASRCLDCHWKGGFAGAGDRVDNAVLFGDGDDLASQDVRNPPALWGVGWAQAIAREMSAELQAIAADAQATAQADGVTVRRPLIAKDVYFGEIAARPDGSLDTAAVEGVDADLVVKPFGWKGTQATLDGFVATSLHLHHGMQSDALIAAPGEIELGDGPPADPDGDGVEHEINAAQHHALARFLATLDVPRMAVPVDGGAFGPPLTGEIEIVDAPEYTDRWLEGAVHFESLGCAGCHTPFMRLDAPRVSVGGQWIDLLTQAARPHPVPDADGVVWVPVFSDFKRHDMGDALAGRHTEGGAGPREYLTRRLWGVANTAPYLHDGRAVTFDEAIRSHGGEAAGAAAAFDALDPGGKASVRVFLIGLKRGPAVRVR